MGNIDTILLSGVTYAISDSAATKVVDITQNDYDNLPSSAKTANILYNITDATAADMSQYWTSAQTNSAITQAVSGKVDSNTYTAYTAATDATLSGKQDTLSAGTGIDITNNVISATGGGGGGGKAIEAGRGISITTGETADTVSFDLPISAGTGTRSVIEGNTKNRASAESAHAEGYRTSASTYAHSEGNQTLASGTSSHAEGTNTIANNQSEHASGSFNVSNKASTTFGDSGNTLFSVGNGTSKSARHNAFEIRQNGDIYYFDGTNDVKLQDKFSSLDTTIGNINTILESI